MISKYLKMDICPFLLLNTNEIFKNLFMNCAFDKLNMFHFLDIKRLYFYIY